MRLAALGGASQPEQRLGRPRLGGKHLLQRPRHAARRRTQEFAKYAARIAHRAVTAGNLNAVVDRVGSGAGQLDIAQPAGETQVAGQRGQDEEHADRGQDRHDREHDRLARTGREHGKYPDGTDRQDDCGGRQTAFSHSGQGILGDHCGSAHVAPLHTREATLIRSNQGRRVAKLRGEPCPDDTQNHIGIAQHGR